jgi:hypothetical protein
MLLLRTSSKTLGARQASPETTATCYTSMHMAPSQGTQVIRRSGAVPFLAIPAEKIFLCELHSVLGDKWGGRVRLTPQLRRDL